MVLPILKYMGDHPSRRLRTGSELTDAIFTGALKHVTSWLETYLAISINTIISGNITGWNLLPTDKTTDW